MAAAPTFSVIGKPIPRVEGRDKVSGGAHYATDVVLPGSLNEEDEGLFTQVEGRVIKHNKAIDCPGAYRCVHDP